MPPICRLRLVVVASSVRIGFDPPPMPESGMGALKVAVSPFTVLPDRLREPGTALATQLLTLVQVASTGALVHVWLAANAEPVAPTAHAMARNRNDNLRKHPKAHFVIGRVFICLWSGVGV